MSKIQVEIRGGTGVGKSAVMQIIMAALEAEGISVKWPDGHEHRPRLPNKLVDCIRSIKAAGTEVELIETCTGR